MSSIYFQTAELNSNNRFKPFRARNNGVFINFWRCVPLATGLLRGPFLFSVSLVGSAKQNWLISVTGAGIVLSSFVVEALSKPIIH
jgi:hypothetical protein